MNILTEEYEKDERITSLYNVLIPFAQYHQNYDEEVEEKLGELIELLRTRMENHNSTGLDIVDTKYIERIFYDKDTLKNMKNNKDK